MTRVRAALPSGLRVILCMKFAAHAPFNEIAEFKRALISDEQVLHSVEVSGSFDFMAEAAHADLSAYQDMLDNLAGRFGHLIEHYEASFVCRRYLREREGPANHLWVPSATGLQRVDHDRIDKITAEGDYVRIHSGAASWLLHATMTSVSNQLGSSHFMRLNRSLIVREDFVERLMHDYRRWTARLFDGSEHIIAKSRSSTIVARLKVDSSASKAGSPLPARADEMAAGNTEKLLR